MQRQDRCLSAPPVENEQLIINTDQVDKLKISLVQENAKLDV